MPVREDLRTAPLPTPVRAGVGLVVEGVRRARTVRLDGLAEMSLRGLGLVASARERVERTYEELANRGETIIAHWRHLPEPRQTPPQTPPPPAQIVLPPAQIVLPDAAPGATLAHDELPLPDYDHLTLGSLRARLSKLDVVALNQLRDYERTHANRLPVVTLFENRIAKVTSAGTLHP